MGGIGHFPKHFLSWKITAQPERLPPKNDLFTWTILWDILQIFHPWKLIPENFIFPQTKPLIQFPRTSPRRIPPSYISIVKNSQSMVQYVPSSQLYCHLFPGINFHGWNIWGNVWWNCPGWNVFFWRLDGNFLREKSSGGGGMSDSLSGAAATLDHAQWLCA